MGRIASVSFGRVAVCAAVAAIALSLPAGASAGVRLGPDLVPVQNSTAFGCQPGKYSPCSYVNLRSTNPEVPVASPSAGVITKWRFRAGCCTDPQTESKTMTLKTFRPGSQDEMLGYGFIVPVTTGPSFVIPAGNQVISDPYVELPVRVPIAAGERIGVVAENPIEFASYAAPNVIETIVASETFYNGEAYGVAYGGALAINVEIEPDGDGDGYGDEAQDCHPGDPTQSGDCPPPYSPPPPPPLLVNKPGSCTANCGGGVVFIHSPQPVAGPRGDGGIVVALQCPPGAVAPCGGILYAELPGSKKKPRLLVSTKSAPRVLAKKGYAIEPGAKENVTLAFSKKTRKVLARKSSRRVTITIVPNSGQTVSTTKTLHFSES